MGSMLGEERTESSNGRCGLRCSEQAAAAAAQVCPLQAVGGGAIKVSFL